jgi:purine nucleoside phosphorylase
MTDLCVITGSGFYDFPGVSEWADRQVETPRGAVLFKEGLWRGKKIAFISRHREGHALLPHMIDYRANCLAAAALKPRAVIATTVCGVLSPAIPLAKLMIFNDLFFPDNRLPTGEICSVFEREGQKGRGHWMFSNPFYDVSEWFSSSRAIKGLAYGHVNGPRFNSVKEISFFAQYCDAISQTCGPETVLFGEMEIPYILLGFGVDYANGVMKENTPPEVLTANMEKSRESFVRAIGVVADRLEEIAFSNFVYRFEDA